MERKKPDDLHTAGATISYQLSCSENHNNLWSTSEFYNSSNQVTAYHRVLLIQFVILQGRSVSVLNAKLSTFVTVTGQNYENLKVFNRICSTDCNMEIILKFEFSGILPARRCPLRHREQPLHGDQEHCEQSGVGTLDWAASEDIGWTEGKQFLNPYAITDWTKSKYFSQARAACDKQIVCIGDARHDSPGFTACWCTYAVLVRI